MHLLATGSRSKGQRYAGGRSMELPKTRLLVIGLCWTLCYGSELRVLQSRQLRQLDDGDVLSAAYFASWGSSTVGCEFDTPPLIARCDASGSILLAEATEATCQIVDDSSIICTSDSNDFDSTAVFICEENDPMLQNQQVFASLEMAATPATSCDDVLARSSSNRTIIYGGVTNSYAALGRFCYDDEERKVVSPVTTETCVEGSVFPSGPNTLCLGEGNCTSTVLCEEAADGTRDCTGPTTCDAVVTKVNIQSQDTNPLCLFTKDTNPLRPRLQASLHNAVWGSGATGGCTFDSSSPLTITCNSGGRLLIVDQAPVVECTLEGTDSAVCTKTDPNGSLLFYCIAVDSNPDQLVATASLDDTGAGAFGCTGSLSGETSFNAIQSIILTRLCGDLSGGVETAFLFSSNQCLDPDQVRFTNGIPFCIEEQTCEIDSVEERCDILLGPVSISDFVGNPTCVTNAPDLEAPTMQPSQAPAVTVAPAAVPTGMPVTQPPVVPSEIFRGIAIPLPNFSASGRSSTLEITVMITNVFCTDIVLGTIEFSSDDGSQENEQCSPVNATLSDFNMRCFSDYEYTTATGITESGAANISAVDNKLQLELVCDNDDSSSIRAKQCESDFNVDETLFEDGISSAVSQILESIFKSLLESNAGTWLCASFQEPRDESVVDFLTTILEQKSSMTMPTKSPTTTPKNMRNMRRMNRNQQRKMRGRPMRRKMRGRQRGNSQGRY